MPHLALRMSGLTWCFRSTVLLLFLACLGASAQQLYSIEESFSNAVTVPPDVIRHLSGDIDLERNGCTQLSLSETLEAVRVGTAEKSSLLFVKPRANAWCLCGANLCPVWMYELKDNRPQLRWHAKATSVIRFTFRASESYPVIVSRGGAAGHGFEETWVWSGAKYVRRNHKQWIAGQ